MDGARWTKDGRGADGCSPLIPLALSPGCVRMRSLDCARDDGVGRAGSQTKDGGLTADDGGQGRRRLLPSHSTGALSKVRAVEISRLRSR